MKPDRIRLKARAYREAWRQRFGAEPSQHNQSLALAVAIHETNAGDSWKGPDALLDTADDEHNWGATTLRALNHDERVVLARAGIVPTVGPGHVQAAKDATAAIVAAGLPLPQGAIHCDSAPTIGPYFVYFATFPTDVEGAAYFIRLLCVRKDGSLKAAYDVLQREHGTAHELAAAMYNAGYYTGFHKRHAILADGRTGDQANIDDFANPPYGIAAIVPSVLRAIAETADTIPPPPATPRNDVPAVLTPRTLRRGDTGGDVKALQDALAAAGFDPGPRDGRFGRLTLDAVVAFQISKGLASDGLAGPKTRGALGLS